MDELNLSETLEDLLKKAARDPDARTGFYRRLLSDNLLMLIGGDDLPQGEVSLDDGVQIEVIPLNDGRIPIFTSQERIFDKGIVKQGVSFARAAGRDIFTFVTDVTFVLNPFSDYGKDLVPGEIADLLSGAIFQPSSSTVTIPAGAGMLIGQPAVYPHALVDALKELFVREATVIAAYLAWIHIPETDKPPHYLIAIQSGSDIGVITAKAGSLAAGYLQPGMLVDFSHITDPSADNYFSQVEPFYKRAT